MTDQQSAAFPYKKWICKKCNITLDQPASERRRGLVKLPLCGEGHTLVATPTPSFAAKFQAGLGLTLLYALFTVLLEFLAKSGLGTGMGTIAVLFHIFYFAWIFGGIWMIFKGRTLR